MRFLSSFSFAFLGFPLLAFAATLSVTPENPLQGEPVMIVVDGADIPDTTSLTFAGKKAPLFLYQGKPIALIAIDLNQKTGKYSLVLKLVSGEKMEKAITVMPREKLSAPLGIPEKLGGNTEAAQNALVFTLAKENTTLANVRTTPLPMWGDVFAFPLQDPEVVDAYGYSRATGSYTIPHKGTDFRASVGTPVRAINAGVVRLARTFTAYGKTVVVDHGGGVQSLSMHLSKIQVKEGQKITKGQTIGLSGDTGYALGPHLHLSVRIGGVSIDPMKFFELFSPRTDFDMSDPK